MLQQAVETAFKTLATGGIILYPTDTIWGIGCDATHAAAIDRIYRLKRRSDTKSLIILAAGEEDILQYTGQKPPDLSAYFTDPDRPTTVIYEHARGLPPNLVNADGSIAIRLVGEPFCQTLIKRLGKPLVSTSANISGQPPAAYYKQITPEIRNGVDYIVDYRQHDETPAAPSRIIRTGPGGQVTVIRP